MKITYYRAVLGLLLAIFLAAHGELSRAEDPFPTVRNSERDAIAQPLPAAAAAAALRMPTGFQVSVFAAEPDVQNPIGMTWDARGRLWIAENYTYAERSQRFDLTMRDRVVILHDGDHDGIAEQRKVFTDRVQMLTSVEVGYGGVWLMCPPRLLFLPDRNYDDIPDGPAEVVLDGFEVAQDNYHNFANGLRWGPDGWLYGRCGGSCPGRIAAPGTAADQRVPLEGGIWRYHPVRKTVETLVHGTTNPWGLDWNAVGEAFFINTVNGHLWHLIPGAHFDRPFALDPNPQTFELIDMHADHWHFDTGKGWTASRDGAANSYGGGHAHTGMMIYLADNWPPAYRDRLFTINIHGRRTNQEILARSGSGYVAKHGEDLMFSADPFYRGLELTYGPDGAVYLLDWSDTGECHESTGVHRTSGRVFRVNYAAAPDSPHPSHPPAFDLRALTDGELFKLLDASNEWFVRQARLVLAERFSASSPPDAAGLTSGENLSPTSSVPSAVTPSSVVQDAREAFDRAADQVTAMRLLLGLHAMQATDRDFLVRQLRHPSEHVRTWAIRLLTDDWPLDDIFAHRSQSASASASARGEAEAEWLLPEFRQLAAQDPSGLVRLALASTLQRLPVPLRLELAAPLVARTGDAADHNLPLLAWYGLIPTATTDPVGLARLAVQCQWPRTQRLIARRLAAEIESQPAAVDLLLRHVAAPATDLATRRNLLSGLDDGLRGWRKTSRPAAWDQVSAALSDVDDPEVRRVVTNLSLVFGDGRALAEVRQLVLDETADVSLRRSALAALVAQPATDELREICLQVLPDARLNVTAAQGLAKFNDPAIGSQLVKNYRRFRSPERPQLIALLASREVFAAALLDAVQNGGIAAGDLTAYDMRQIRSLGNPELDARAAQLWGEVRESGPETQQRIQSLKAQLTPQTLHQANPSVGRQLFDKTCAKCHRLYGAGEQIGPDLTGANRDNLDYLLENVLDPSAVVNKDFRMSVVALRDGRVLNGLVVSRNDKIMTLQTQTDLLTISADEIEEVHTTSLSPMPDGLLDNLSEQAIRDLYAYLMQPGQVPLPE